MARGRGGYGGDVIVETRAGNPSSRASRISAYTIEDTDQMQSASKRQDKALMRDITSRLYKLEFESVKPSFNVAMKTGFRRKMYHKKLPAIGKEAKEEFHKNRLKYPWDYTNDNLYRSTPKKKKTKKEEVKDQAEGDPYPEYDPLGLYRPRPKRERNPMPEASAAAERYEKMSPREILSDLRVKTFSKPRFRDPSDDISNLLEQISRPLPQSEVKEYVPATGDIYDFEPTIPADEKCMDPAIGKKIEASKGEIAEFERMLDRFAKKTVKPRIPPPPVFVPAAARPLHLEGSGSEDELDLERELGLDYPDIDDYEPPHIVPRSALTTHASARQAPVGAIRRTPHLSTPKSRYREIEARVEAMGDPVIGYQPTPDSLTSLRSRTANAKSKMDHHKVLLDRYLPVSMGPVSAVEYEVEDKYGELAARMPVLEQYRRSEPITGSMGYVTPYKPAARARAGSLDSSVPRASGTRPPVSETRRRAREVLCKTKGDPNYYSY